MTAYPVFFSVSRPDMLERGALLWRVAILVMLSIAGVTLGVFSALAYLVLPVVAAMGLAKKGPDRFLAEDAPRLARALRWIVSAYAYFMLLTDRLPSEDDSVRLEIEPSSAWPEPDRRPSTVTALMRLFFSLPTAVFLALLGVISWVVWLVAAVMIFVTEDYPQPLYSFQCGVLRWQARFLGYHASLVEAYPPFSFDPGPFPVADQAPLAH